MKTTVFMPIKLNNERTPGKNLKKFDDGTALLQVPLKTAVEAMHDGDIDRIVVFCSNPAIQEYLPEGVEFIQRPEIRLNLSVHSEKANWFLHAGLQVPEKLSLLLQRHCVFSFHIRSVK